MNTIEKLLTGAILIGGLAAGYDRLPQCVVNNTMMAAPNVTYQIVKAGACYLLEE